MNLTDYKWFLFDPLKNEKQSRLKRVAINLERKWKLKGFEILWKIKSKFDIKMNNSCQTLFWIFEGYCYSTVIPFVQHLWATNDNYLINITCFNNSFINGFWYVMGIKFEFLHSEPINFLITIQEPHSTTIFHFSTFNCFEKLLKSH